MEDKKRPVEKKQKQKDKRVENQHSKKDPYQRDLDRLNREVNLRIDGRFDQNDKVSRK